MHEFITPAVVIHGGVTDFYIFFTHNYLLEDSVGSCTLELATLLRLLLLFKLGAAKLHAPARVSVVDTKKKKKTFYFTEFT